MVRFLRSVTALLPTASPAKTKVRFPQLHENDSSVASWVAIGEIQLLLGADLEEHHQSGRGWTAVLASSTRPAGVACLFKIAHHGSGTGHHDQVWSQMLVKNPIAVLTPWTLGGNQLPNSNDVARIASFTTNGYSTAQLASPGLVGLLPAVRKTLNEAGITIRRLQASTGFVRLRSPIGSTQPVWSIAASPDAVHLT
jgi:hypothetical protein